MVVGVGKSISKVKATVKKKVSTKKTSSSDAYKKAKRALRNLRRYRP